MQINVEGHAKFHDAFEVWHQFIAEVSSKKTTWNPERFKETLISFLPDLMQHLQEEVDTLLSQIMAMNNVDIEAENRPSAR